MGLIQTGGGNVARSPLVWGSSGRDHHVGPPDRGPSPVVTAPPEEVVRDAGRDALPVEGVHRVEVPTEEAPLVQAVGRGLPVLGRSPWAGGGEVGREGMTVVRSGTRK